MKLNWTGYYIYYQIQHQKHIIHIYIDNTHNIYPNYAKSENYLGWTREIPPLSRCNQIATIIAIIATSPGHGSFQPNHHIRPPPANWQLTQVFIAFNLSTRNISVFPRPVPPRILMRATHRRSRRRVAFPFLIGTANCNSFNARFPDIRKREDLRS